MKHQSEQRKREHERNVIGRRLINVEKALELPLTEREEMEKVVGKNLDRQVHYLSRKLEKLGGPRLRQAKFSLEDTPSFIGYTYGDTWNGWACPYFRKEVADEIIKWFNDNRQEGKSESKYVEELDGYLIGWEADSGEDEPIANRICKRDDKNGLYPIGAGSWIWQEEEGEPVRNS